MWPWDPLIYGGKEGVGSGEFEYICLCWRRTDKCRDVAAGIAILQEAGGLVTTANPPFPDEETAPIENVRLGSRFYLAIRPAGDSPGESGRQSQERTVREVWKRVRNLEYTRPGG